MTVLIRFAIITVAAATALPAAAATPGSDRRLAATETRDTAQERRITAGASNGTINANEAARLNAQQAGIDRTQTRLAADGQFSRRDYARVDYRQDKANRNIARARNNRR
ncbi:MAG: hypothetical protein ACOYLS_10250 [Polymorphobacter sp.]